MSWRVWVLWLLFVVRGSFYCATLPLWEGWDEYAHFAYLQHWIDHGTLLKHTDPVSREIDESMRLTPLAYELSWIGPPYLTHSQWWALPETERAPRLRNLKSMPTGWQHEPALHPFDSYEAQQPPLYYWLVSIPLRWVSSWPLESRVQLIRLLSMLLASSAILLLRNSVYAAALLAVAPCFAINASRIANDSLAIALVAVLLCLLDKRGWIVGLVLGAALLTKAYLIALIPALIVIWWKRKRELGIALLVAITISGWWYGRNLAAGSSLTGWEVHATPGQVLIGVFQINWFGTLHVVAKSFLWFGAWSFLTLKSWMYLIVEAGCLAAAVLAWKRRAEVRVPAIVTGFYLLAIAYGSIIYWVGQHVPNLPGWYLWPIGSQIMLILAAGLRRWSVSLIAALGAIDIYGMAALLIPYWAGLAERNHAAIGQFLPGLARLGTPLWLAVVWIASTIAIVVMANYDSDYRHRRNSPKL